MPKLTEILGVFALLSVFLIVATVLAQRQDKTETGYRETVQRIPVERVDRRVVVVGDLHGDYTALERILKYAQVDNATVLVQVGDLLDRGDDTIPLLDFFLRNHSHPVLNILGNHEAMNLAGQLRYVSPGDFASFGGEAARRKAFEKGQPYGDLLRGFSTR